MLHSLNSLSQGLRWSGRQPNDIAGYRLVSTPAVDEQETPFIEIPARALNVTPRTYTEAILSGVGLGAVLYSIYQATRILGWL